MKRALIQIPGPALIGFDHVFTGAATAPSLPQTMPAHRCTICGELHASAKGDGAKEEAPMMGLDFLGL